MSGQESAGMREQNSQEELVMSGEFMRNVVHGLKDLQAALESIAEFENLSRDQLLGIAKHSLDSVDLIRRSLDIDRDGNKQKQKE